MDEWELAARVMIGVLHREYVAAIDAEVPGDLSPLFTDEGILRSEISGRSVTGTAFRTYLATVRSTRRKPAWTTMRHYITPPDIQFIDRDHAAAQCYYTVLSAVGVDHWGTYSDQVERRGDRWLLAERVTSLQGASPGGWVASSLAELAKG